LYTGKGLKRESESYRILFPLSVFSRNVVPYKKARQIGNINVLMFWKKI
jgi:hypothetical protein